MNNKIQLSSNHNRSLSVTARAIEKTVSEIELLLNGNHKTYTAEIIEPVYSKEKKEEILKKLNKLKEVNDEMFETLKLRSQKLAEDRVVYSNLSYLWTILIDSKSDKLTRYGDVPADNAEIIDNYIDRLLNIIGELKQYRS
ncbi:MAG TPA: hypothetical protein ENI57_03660 [Ignavibacteria bacterium]|nr:hypothetical protein [Ignavibacteria bacterium]